MNSPLDKIKIPDAFFRESWEDADHPMACVDINNKFVKVNHAFERLLGYSAPEMTGKTWMEYTADEHVGGDAKSVRSVISGTIDSYQMEKDYIHRRGYKVPVKLIVRRYPRNSAEDLVFFRVEAAPVAITRAELVDLQEQNEKRDKKIEDVVKRIAVRLKKLEERGFVRVDTNIGDNKEINVVGGDQVGGDKTTNSTKSIKYLAIGSIVLSICVAWFAYYVASMNKTEMPEPPTVSSPLDE